MLSSIGAFLLLGETPTLAGVLGLLAVVVGIALISTQGNLAVFRQRGSQAGVRWGVVIGLFIAGYTMVDAFGVKSLGIAPVLLDWCANGVRLVLLTPIVVRDPARAIGMMRGHWLLAAGVGVLAPLGYILVLTALDQGAPLSVVAPMREMSMMIGVLLGLTLLKERVGPWRLVGCAVLIAGVILLGAS